MGLNSGRKFIFGDEQADDFGVEYDKKIVSQYKKWVTLYRLNFDIFVEHYLGIKKLKLFQKIMIHLMGLSEIFVTVASRGISKSYTIGLYSVARCILYPNTKIIIASGTKGQAALIIKEKIIGEFYKDSPTLRLEIKSWSISQNNVEIQFRNGSKILAVTSSDNSRGFRGNVLIMDEFRLIKPEIRDEVLIPMLSVPRQPEYLTNPKFKEYVQEENIQIYISSAWYSSEWIYEYSLKAFKDAILGKTSTYFLAMDYHLALEERLTTEKYIDSQKSKMGEVSFAMEFDTIFYGQNKNALFTHEYLKRARVLKKAFVPLKDEDYLLNKLKHHDKIMKSRESGEIRIIGVDVALLGGKNNDASQFVCMRLVPKGTHYVRKVDYIESMEGVHSAIQAIRLKQLFEDYCADYVVMDCNGTSLPLYEAVSQKQLDPMRGTEYEAWAAYNNENLKSRAISDNPLMVIYAVIPNAFSNHEMATVLRTTISDRNLELLLEENDAFEQFIKVKAITEFADDENMTSEEFAVKKIELLQAYMQTTAFINETINLNYEMSGGYIKIITKGRARKDRYSALLYANYFAKIKEDENLRIEYGDYADQPVMVRILQI